MPVPLKLLIVEDVREDAALMERALTRHGFSATCERVDSQAALTTALRNDPQVVLADYKVPNLTLESVLATVRRHPDQPPVIVVSGAVGEETAAATIRLGAVDYVMKDRLQRLGAAVERALADAQLRRREREHLTALAHFERLKSAGELATGFAHELNQPLTAILLQSEIAAQLAVPLTGPSRDKLLAVIETIGQQAARAGDIIRVLRRLIKKSEAARSTLVIDEIVRDAVKIMEHDLRQNGINVAFHSDTGLPTILGDTIQLQQVMINLLRNAIESMIDVPLANRQLVITCRTATFAEAPFVSVSVSDCGGGMTDQDQARLFENFFTTKVQGMGLGLAICRSIMESHGGKIECHQNPTAGVTFEMLLPVHRTTDSAHGQK